MTKYNITDEQKDDLITFLLENIFTTDEGVYTSWLEHINFLSCTNLSSEKKKFIHNFLRQNEL